MKKEQVVCTPHHKGGTCQLLAIGPVVQLDPSHLLAIGPGAGGVGGSVITRKLLNIECILIRYVCLACTKCTLLGVYVGGNFGECGQMHHIDVGG